MNTNKEDLLQCVEEAVSAETKDENLILTYFRDCEQLGLEILPCDINTSQAACAFEDENHVRLGLSVLVPEEEPLVNVLLAERQKKGKFHSFQNLCERLDLDQIPSEFLARLIEGGAFDSTGETRARLFKGYPRILQGVRKAKADQASQQISLFALAPAASKAESIPIELPKVDEWTEEERIDHERQATGFSFTAYWRQQAETEEKESLLEEVSAEEDERAEKSDVPKEEAQAAPHEQIEAAPIETVQESIKPAPVKVPQEEVEVSQESGEPAPAEAPQEEAQTSVETREQSELPPAAIPDEETDDEEPFVREETPPLPPEEFSPEEYEAIYAKEQEQQQPGSDEDSEPAREAADDEEKVDSEPAREAAAAEEEEEEAALAALVIRFRPTVTEDTLYQLRHLLEQYRGDASVILEFVDDSAPATLIKTHSDYAVDMSESFMQAVRQLVGEESIRLSEESG